MSLLSNLMAAMKMPIILLSLLSLSTLTAFAQALGNIGYGQATGRTRAEQNEREKRAPLQAEASPGSNSMFIDASVLMNVKADEYVGLFGVFQEGATVAECNQKMDATIGAFLEALRPLGIGKDDTFVDFAAQNRIYGYKVEGNLAKEELVGFELKKNVSVHYRDKLLLDKLVIAAAASRIFDLIKVDYIVKDAEKVQNQLMEEATRVLKQKAARREKLLGIKLLPPPQVYAEKPSVYSPTQLYDSYTAYEAENVERQDFRSKYTVQDARKSRTFFFNPLGADGFDSVINPVIIEPVVQFTLYLKVKYDTEPRKHR